MNAYEIAQRFGVSLSKARKISKASILPPGKKDDASAAIRLKLSRKLQLSAEQLINLWKQPCLISKLGKYENQARAQLVMLGNVSAGTAPIEVTQRIGDAAGGNLDGIETIMRWLKSTMPQGPVRYHWIAIRLLLNQWPDLQRGDFARVHLALKNVRAHPDFDEWWDFEPIGSQWPTVYRRPATPFDW